MGVIKKTDHTVNVNIKSSISEETLYIPSSDDEHSIPQFEEGRPRRHPRILRNHIPTVGPSFSGLKTHSGKKKSRRYFNVSELVTLAEEDELQEVTIEDFVENSKSAFTVLLEDNKNLEKWDEFVESSEEKQQQFISEHRKKKPKNMNYPFQQKLNVALKNLLRKNNLPVGMLQFLEDELVSFFVAMPTQTYISRQLNSFERLLLHSVSDYHRLKSLSFDSEPEGVRLVRVKNPRKEFFSPPLLLAQYVEMMRRVN